MRLAATTVGVVLLLDGAPFNPTGFAARLRFLTGPASQDFASFSKDAAGFRAVLVEALGFLPGHHYPLLVGLLALLGFVLAAGQRRLVAIVPLLAIVSYTIAFNGVARRVEERFLLPQMQLVAIYAAGAIVWTGERRGLVARLAGFVAVAHGLWLSAIVIANLLRDPRYDAEAWLAANVVPGEVVETYGSNVYLPRFPAGETVQRIGASSPRARNPMPGIVEVQGSPADIEERRPDYVVLSEGHVWRYLQAPGREGGGPMMPLVQQRTLGEEAAVSAWFHALFAGETAYELRHASDFPATSIFPRRRLHGALGSSVWVFARKGSR